MATCKVLTAHGAIVIGTGRNKESLLKRKEEKHILDYIVSDLTATEKNNCQEVVDEAVRLLGGHLTSLINGAGILIGGAMGDSDVDTENYNLNMRTNVQAPFELTVHCIPYMRRSKASSCPHRHRSRAWKTSTMGYPRHVAVCNDPRDGAL